MFKVWSTQYVFCIKKKKEDSRIGKKVCETTFKGQFKQNVFLHLKTQDGAMGEKLNVLKLIFFLFKLSLI